MSTLLAILLLSAAPSSLGRRMDRLIKDVVTPDRAHDHRQLASKAPHWRRCLLVHVFKPIVRLRDAHLDINRPAPGHPSALLALLRSADIAGHMGRLSADRRHESNAWQPPSRLKLGFCHIDTAMACPKNLFAAQNEGKTACGETTSLCCLTI